MLQGLLAVIALFFTGAPAAAPEPAPLLSFDTAPGPPSAYMQCKSPASIWVHVTGPDQISIRVFDPYGVAPELPSTTTPGQLQALLKRAGPESELSDRVFVRADEDLPYGDVMAQVGFLRSIGVRKIALIGPREGAGR